MRILQVANFVSPTSGGIRTALAHWARGYVAAGHAVGAIIPEVGAGQETWRWDTPAEVAQLPGLPLPGAPSYRVITSRTAVMTAISSFAPDVLEISDRTTLRWLSPWARSRGIACVMVSHENVRDVARTHRVPAALATALADRLNAASAAGVDAVVAPSTYAAREFVRLGVPAHVVPLGVDRDVFTPAGATPSTNGAVQLVHVGRLSTEKWPQLSLRTLVELVRSGVDAELTVVGDGPLRDRLAWEAAGFPVELIGHRSQAEVAAVVRDADVVVAPAPAETFGLAALEAMACGTPVVSGRTGALPEVVGAGGLAVQAGPASFAAAVQALATDPVPRREARAAALARAAELTWEASARRMLHVHHEVLGIAARVPSVVGA